MNQKWLVIAGQAEREREREIKIGNVLLDYHPGRVSHLFSVGLGLHKSIRDEKKKKGGL